MPGIEKNPLPTESQPENDAALIYGLISVDAFKPIAKEKLLPALIKKIQKGESIDSILETGEKYEYLTKKNVEEIRTAEETYKEEKSLRKQGVAETSRKEKAATGQTFIARSNNKEITWEEIGKKGNDLEFRISKPESLSNIVKIVKKNGYKKALQNYSEQLFTEKVYSYRFDNELKDTAEDVSSTIHEDNTIDLEKDALIKKREDVVKESTGKLMHQILGKMRQAKRVAQNDKKIDTESIAEPTRLETEIVDTSMGEQFETTTSTAPITEEVAAASSGKEKRRSAPKKEKLNIPVTTPNPYATGEFEAKMAIEKRKKEEKRLSIQLQIEEIEARQREIIEEQKVLLTLKRMVEEELQRRAQNKNLKPKIEKELLIPTIVEDETPVDVNASEPKEFVLRDYTEEGGEELTEEERVLIENKLVELMDTETQNNTKKEVLEKIEKTEKEKNIVPVIGETENVLAKKEEDTEPILEKTKEVTQEIPQVVVEHTQDTSKKEAVVFDEEKSKDYWTLVGKGKELTKKFQNLYSIKYSKKAETTRAEIINLGKQKERAIRAIVDSLPASNTNKDDLYVAVAKQFEAADNNGYYELFNKREDILKRIGKINPARPSMKQIGLLDEAEMVKKSMDAILYPKAKTAEDLKKEAYEKILAKYYRLTRERKEEKDLFDKKEKELVSWGKEKLAKRIAFLDKRIDVVVSELAAFDKTLRSEEK